VLAVGVSHTLGASLVDVFFVYMLAILSGWRVPCTPLFCKHGDQLPLPRALPLWGGVSEGGYAVVAIHENKKMTADEFVEVVRKGKKTDAIRKLNPIKPDGPWFALCDNESFLEKAKATKEVVADQGVSLWHIPPPSPDLNPVGKCWAWLRRDLRRLDLQDLSKKKRPLSKSALRVHSLCGSQKAQRVASNFAKGLKARLQ
jgi:transposase